MRASEGVPPKSRPATSPPKGATTPSGIPAGYTRSSTQKPMVIQKSTRPRMGSTMKSCTVESEYSRAQAMAIAVMAAAGPKTKAGMESLRRRVADEAVDEHRRQVAEDHREREEAHESPRAPALLERSAEEVETDQREQEVAPARWAGQQARA